MKNIIRNKTLQRKGSDKISISPIISSRHLNKIANLNSKEDIYIVCVAQGVIIVDEGKYQEIKNDFIVENMEFLEEDYTIEHKKLEEIFDREYVINKIKGIENE